MERMKFVAVDGVSIQIFNMMYHNGMNSTNLYFILFYCLQLKTSQKY